MTTLGVNLFGRFYAERCGQELHGLDNRKVQELFCYLLLHRNKPHPREALAALLWGDATTEQSKIYLRKTLWQLQVALQPAPGSEESPGGSSQLFVVDAGWVRVRTDADLSFDVAAFEQAHAVGRCGHNGLLTEDASRVVEQAVALYSGDLLEGWYQDWCLLERERLQQMYMVMLNKLVNYHESVYHYDEAIHYGGQILRCERAHERTHRKLIELHYLAGDRTAALRQYERCAAALGDELGIRPDKETTSLYEHIKANSSPQ